MPLKYSCRNSVLSLCCRFNTGEGTELEDLRNLQAPPGLLRAVNRSEEFRQGQQEYRTMTGSLSSVACL
jgi:hypothetical protein